MLLGRGLLCFMLRGFLPRRRPIEAHVLSPFGPTPVSLTTLSRSACSRLFLFLSLFSHSPLSITITHLCCATRPSSRFFFGLCLLSQPLLQSPYPPTFQSFSALFIPPIASNFEIPRYCPNARKLACHIKASQPATSLEFLLILAIRRSCILLMLPLISFA